jgi:serine/threonine protein kinase
MTLTAGTRLGVYEVTGLLGVGGMGEVYRATDTKLGRKVAIKTLPAELASDKDRLARFEREAKLLAALNHPHIASVYSLDEHDGTLYLAMELVEGETLEAKLKRGALPIDEAIRLGLQIAEALEAAHGRGVVHRDLKPANVMVTRDGVVKVLDFGLAKAFSVDPHRTIAGYSPALSLAMTQQGLVIGTAGYMSPEQASGQATDQRTDIWAFGVLLYEMLTGTPMFSGESVPHILAAVLKTEPDWNRLPKNHPRLRSLLDRCLRKKVRDRYHSMADVRIEIEESMKSASEGFQERPSRRVAAFVVASVLSAVLAASAMAMWIRAAAPARDVTSPVMHLDLNLPSGVELYAGQGQNVAISPDSQEVAFVGLSCGVRQVFVRREPDALVRQIRGTGIATQVFFSPDGRSLGSLDNTSGLKTISLADDSSVLLTDHVDGNGGGTWGADGRITFVRDNLLWQIPARGGEAIRLTELDATKGEQRHAWPVAIGNGGQVMFTVITGLNRNASHIEILTVASGKREVVVDRAMYARVVPAGQLVFFRDNTLEVAAFDIARPTPNDSPARVMEDLAVAINGAPILDFSEHGTLVYESKREASSHLVWKSRNGSEEQVTDASAGYYAPRLSLDGRILVAHDGDLWIQDPRGAMSVLTSGLNTGSSYPVWTQDGSKIVFRTQTGLAWITPDGTGKVQPIAGTTTYDYPASVAADNSTLVFVRLSGENSGDIYALSLNGDVPAHAVVTGPAYEGGPQISPDGRWLAFASNRTGRFEVYVQGFPTGDGATTISTQGGNQPRWSANGKEIVYRQCDKMMAVDVESIPGASKVLLGTPHVIFEQAYLSGSSTTIPDYDVSPDGERFLMVKSESQRTLHVVLNWFDDLKRLAATK